MAKKKSASKRPTTNSSSAEIRVRLFDGTRKPLKAQRQYLLRLLDGQHEQLVARDLRGAERTFEVPFHDNFLDAYSVLVSAHHCADAGFFPVTVSPGVPALTDVMLISNPPQFDFENADWDRISTSWPQASKALAFGTGAEQARRRYDALLHTPERAAAFWNIVTAMRDVDLPQGSVLQYLREVSWDAPFAPAPDRFFAFAEIGLVEQVVTAAAQGAFDPEPNPGLFHPDATRSFKQVAFGEANLQLTFHEKITKKVNGETWVRIEPDIDYFKDLAAHALLEVLPNSITGGKTHPATVYVLRWIAGRHAGVPEFDPPYLIVGP